MKNFTKLTVFILFIVLTGWAFVASASVFDLNNNAKPVNHFIDTTNHHLCYACKE